MKAPAKRRKYGLNVWKAHLKIDAMHIEAMYDGMTRPPQSWRYITNEQAAIMERRKNNADQR